MANTLANLYNAGNSSANATAVQTTSQNFTLGNLVAFPVRWSQGSGGTTRTLSAVTSTVTGDDANITIVAGTDRESTTGVWEQWVVVRSVSSTGARQFTATLSGQADNVEIPFMIELTGIHASAPIGVVAIGGNAFGDPQEVTLTGVSANSTILMMNSAAAGGTAGTIYAGFAAITMPTSPFTANGDLGKAGYWLDAGAAGNKNVGWNGTAGVWSTSAIEIKTAAGGNLGPIAMHQLKQQGIA